MPFRKLLPFLFAEAQPRRRMGLPIAGKAEPHRTEGGEPQHRRTLKVHETERFFSTHAWATLALKLISFLEALIDNAF
jgi:hypothetical protein